MSSPVFITGIGMISSIGKNIEESFRSLSNSQSGIGKLNYIKTRHRDFVSVGEVPFSDDQLMELANVSKKNKLSRTTLLGIIAANEALTSANIVDVNEFRTGLISATSVGGMGLAENHYMEYLDPDDAGKYLGYIRQLDCSDSSEKIASSLGITDFVSTISTACSSSANAIMYGARLIGNNILDRVIVGGTDALSRFTINGFSTLKILDPQPCKPFDAGRNGLNLGEGAGYIVLESEKTVKNKAIYGRLAGYGNSNDAYHQTASSPEGTGAILAMKKAFNKSGISPEAIDYINAHGTGTELNDLSEGLAIQKVFGDKIPPLSSTKSYTGHTLAAAGGIEAVISVLSMHYNIIFPNLNFKIPMPELNFQPLINAALQNKINHVLSNSFGFGGNTSSLIFSRS